MLPCLFFKEPMLCSLKNIIKLYIIFLGILFVEKSISYKNDIYLMLRELIELKSSRDEKIFTVYQLAKAINMPHSIIVKLLHPDPTKRVNNPRIDTLVKIIDFFKTDGFMVKIDDFLFIEKEIDILSQPINNHYFEKNIQIFSLNYASKQIGTINIKLPNDYNNLMAYVSEEDIKPLFKAGSIFIVDKDSIPENDNLVAIKVEKSNKILIKKLFNNGSEQILTSLDDINQKMQLSKTIGYIIIGVVIQVNAKT